MAARRAEHLAARMHKRLAQLEAEKHIVAAPPIVTGGAVIIPRGLLNKIMGSGQRFTVDATARRKIESIAMRTVMAIETELGFFPRDVSNEKVGYDIESRTYGAKRETAGSSFRFIEVKGRVVGADTVTVTKNEILTAFNKPDDYILAIVQIDGEQTSTVYLKTPFSERPDFAATSVNYNISNLIESSEIILKRGHKYVQEKAN